MGCADSKAMLTSPCLGRSLVAKKAELDVTLLVICSSETVEKLLDP
jgi:hypothetical protein